MTDRRDDAAGQRGDRLREAAEAKQTVANDAVAGETVLPGPGDGNDGPTGGATREQEPAYAENDLAGEDIDLADAPESTE